MNVRRFELETAARPADRTPAVRADAAGRPEMRTSPAGDDDDQPGDELLDEPGYGHGV